MDAFEPIRIEAAALSEALVAAGADPLSARVVRLRQLATVNWLKIEDFQKMFN